jgi:nicotinamidase-related amidase
MMQLPATSPTWGKSMHTALILIDAQQSFVQRPYYSGRDVGHYLEAQNALLSGATARNVPIVRIFHVEADPESAFSLTSGLIRPIDGLREIQPAVTFHKSRHSALVGSGLDVWLTQNGIRRLIISGIRTEQCCETTTRHASDLGYDVDYALDATLTFDMKNGDGTPLPAHLIKQRTAAVLEGRFANVVTVEQALERTNAH